jgi:hypothetical protein
MNSMFEILSNGDSYVKQTTILDSSDASYNITISIFVDYTLHT